MSTPIEIPFGQDYGLFQHWVSEIRQFGAKYRANRITAISVPFGSTPVNFHPLVPEDLKGTVPEPALGSLCCLLRRNCYAEQTNQPLLTSLFNAIWEPPAIFELVPDEEPMAARVPNTNLQLLGDRIITPKYCFDVENDWHFNPYSVAMALWDMPYGLSAELLSKVLATQTSAREAWPEETLYTFGQYRSPKIRAKNDGYMLEVYAWLYSAGMVYREVHCGPG